MPAVFFGGTAGGPADNAARGTARAALFPFAAECTKKASHNEKKFYARVFAFSQAIG